VVDTPTGRLVGTKAKYRHCALYLPLQEPTLKPRPLCHPPGPFHWAIVRPEELVKRRETVWPTAPEVLGIDFRPGEHWRSLTEVFPRYAPDSRYPEYEATSDRQSYDKNPQFGWLDSRALFVLLRDLKPKRVIEIDGGFSSLLTADVHLQWCDGAIDFECIAPHPRPLLERGLPGMTRLPVSAWNAWTLIPSKRVIRRGGEEILSQIAPRRLRTRATADVPLRCIPSTRTGDGRTRREARRAVGCVSSAARRCPPRSNDLSASPSPGMCWMMSQTPSLIENPT
jgi:hypothetical protein